MKDVLSIIEKNRDDYLKTLRELCRMESISAQNRGIEETAEAVRSLLDDAGARTKILSAEGANPAVYSEFKGESERTLLFYNHYDVQPPEPLDEWKHPPFSAGIEDGTLYARGAADDKGDFLARLFAVKSILQSGKNLPVNVKFFVDGEEEIGSPGIEDIIKTHPESVRADACVWETGRKTFDGRPVILLGIKGMLYVELSAKGADTDSHSSLATTIPNPAWRLAWALNTLKDCGENIKIAGFLDDVRPLEEKEISALKQIPDEDEEKKKHLGIDKFLMNLSGFERVKRDITSPTCTICGLSSGYTGEGSKTVLPARAKAKVDFRLVPEQDPEDILRKLRKHLDSEGFKDIKITPFSMEKAFKTPVDSEFAKLVSETAEKTYGKKAVIYPAMPGTGPMHQVCGENKTPCAGCGISNPNSSMHAPNENIKIEDFFQGIEHIARIIGNF